MQRIALLSVSDKTGIVDFADGLNALNFRILSTGGTAKLLKSKGIPVLEISKFTGSPEILGGRVKTLHPKIHGGILVDRSNKTHLDEAEKFNIEPIDLVVVNLYQFQKFAVSKNLDLKEAIEHIDIGGPTLLRAAAKNYKYCTPVIDPNDYIKILLELRDNNGSISEQLKILLARKTFSLISSYDSMISDYFYNFESAPEVLPDRLFLNYKLISSLRYGENPHQKASLYALKNAEGFATCEILHGKTLGFNNYIDLDAACQIVVEFKNHSCITIIKHTNPCGSAIGTHEKPLKEIYLNALSCDPQSAFGSIIACNNKIDKDTAEEMHKLFIECIAAPDYDDEALKILTQKKNIRILKLPYLKTPNNSSLEELQLKSIKGALLVQTLDNTLSSPEDWTYPTTIKPDLDQIKDLSFAMIIAKHVKSNAIVFAKNNTTLGIGAGQMSRIDAAQLAAKKAQDFGHSLDGAVMASDGFMPFNDVALFAAKHKISSIIQPGGSKRDQDSIDACNDQGLSMVFTGTRHFRH